MPELRLLYETAPIGLAFLTPDCRYQLINRHLCEICGLSVADHIGRSVRETVPQVAEQVEKIVQTILRTGNSITGIEVSGQRPDGANADSHDQQKQQSYLQLHRLLGVCGSDPCCDDGLDGPPRTSRVA